MEANNRQVWMARILALLIISLGLSIIVGFNRNKTQVFTKRIEVRAGSDTGEIISAVERLGRDDIAIDVRDEWQVYGKLGFLKAALGMFIAFGIILAIYHAVYCLCRALIISSSNRDIERSLDNPLNLR